MDLGTESIENAYTGLYNDCPITPENTNGPKICDLMAVFPEK